MKLLIIFMFLFSGVAPQTHTGKTRCLDDADRNYQRCLAHCRVRYPPRPQIQLACRQACRTLRREDRRNCNRN